MRLSKKPIEPARFGGVSLAPAAARVAHAAACAHMAAAGRARRLAHALALVLSMAAFAGCSALAQQASGALAVRDARISVTGGKAMLELGLDCRLSGPMQDALDHGIPLTLRIGLRAGSAYAARAAAVRRVELRYFPLSRRYQLRELEAADVRTFASPAYLVAALGSLRIDLPTQFAALPAGESLRVAVRLDPAALPGALRLPALFEPAWRLAAADYSWPRAAH